MNLKDTGLSSAATQRAQAGASMLAAAIGLFTLISWSGGSALHAADSHPDKWFSGDKRAHFTGGLLIATAFSSQVGSHSSGLLVGCATGAVGELLQVPHSGWISKDVSAKDFVAECAGAVAGSYIGVELASNETVHDANRNHTSDRWLSADKFSHFLGGAALSSLVAAYTDSATAGFLAGCALGAVGELLDATQHGWNSKHVSSKDFAVACLGAWVGADLSVQVAPDRIVWSKRF